MTRVKVENADSSFYADSYFQSELSVENNGFHEIPKPLERPGESKTVASLNSVQH